MRGRASSPMLYAAQGRDRPTLLWQPVRGMHLGIFFIKVTLARCFKKEKGNKKEREKKGAVIASPSVVTL